MHDLEDSSELELDLSDGQEDTSPEPNSEDESSSSEDEMDKGASEEKKDAAQVDEDVIGDLLPTQEQLEEQRQENVRALVSGNLNITRKPVLPKLLTVADAELQLKLPFKSPHPSAPSRTEALKRALVARKQFVPWGCGRPFQPLRPMTVPQADAAAAPTAAPPVVLPPGVEPLILWEPPPGVEGPCVRVDDMVTRWLRPHQREGVQFMFECVAGLRSFDGQGCILADDMGLGKTLQGIALLWTLLNGGHEALGGCPLAQRVIICCPTSLVSNWDSECTKWLNGRVRTLPLCESSREEVVATVNQFLMPRCPAQLLIVSYETFRLHAERFKAVGSCDLLICDEAHRLKNDQTLTNRALDSLACRRRVLLSGTPMQNQLQEFYAMVNFCNPGVLGTPAQFRRHYEAPVLAGREPGASDAEVALGSERSAQLSGIVNEFILRRTNALLSAHLPPKVVELVCCRMTPLQYELYCHFVQSRSVRSLFSSHKSARVLSAITSLRKLLNHPKLIFDMVHSSARADTAGADGFENCGRLFPPGLFDSGRGGRAGGGGGLPQGWENLSGKFAVVSRMLALLREQTPDRVVIVSNYTQTLDLFTALCRERGYPCLRLDGSTSINKRQKLVVRFNDPADNQFVFLLSSKAGGCGLNLVGGNRLVLFDMSWNPADDKQAAARVWRDGQKRRVYVYRFMTTGTMEEKVFQRQLSKEGLQQVVEAREGGGRAGANLMSAEELRDLFSYDPDTLSTTYDHMVAGAHPDGGGAADGKEGTKPAAGKGKESGGGEAGRGGEAGAKRSILDDGEEEDEVVVVEDSVIGSDDSGSGSSSSEDEDEEQHEGKGPAAAAGGETSNNSGDGGRGLTSAALAAGGGVHREQVGKPKEEDLKSWGHHSRPSTVPDQVMQQAGGAEVTFVFSCQVDGRHVAPDAPLVPLGQGKPAAVGAAHGKFSSAAGGGGMVGGRKEPSRSSMGAKAAAIPPAAASKSRAAMVAPAAAPTNENAVVNIAARPSKLSLPKPQPMAGSKRAAAASAGAAASKRRPLQAAPPASKRLVVFSDSDSDDFK